MKNKILLEKFTLGIKDSSVKSPNIILVIEDLNLLIMKTYWWDNIHLMLSYHPHLTLSATYDAT
jgi:hypothetical protein